MSFKEAEVTLACRKLFKQDGGCRKQSRKRNRRGTISCVLSLGCEI